ARIRVCQIPSGLAASIKSSSKSAIFSSWLYLINHTTSSSNCLAAGSYPYGPILPWACDQSPLAISTILFSDFFTASLSDSPNSKCFSNERSLDGVITTIGTSGMKRSGTIAPQSRGKQEIGPDEVP